VDLCPKLCKKGLVRGGRAVSIHVTQRKYGLNRLWGGVGVWGGGGLCSSKPLRSPSFSAHLSNCLERKRAVPAAGRGAPTEGGKSVLQWKKAGNCSLIPLCRCRISIRISGKDEFGQVKASSARTPRLERARKSRSTTRGSPPFVRLTSCGQAIRESPARGGKIPLLKRNQRDERGNFV